MRLTIKSKSVESIPTQKHIRRGPGKIPQARDLPTQGTSQPFKVWRVATGDRGMIERAAIFDDRGKEVISCDLTRKTAVKTGDTIVPDFEFHWHI